MTEPIPLRQLDGDVRNWLYAELCDLTLTLQGFEYQLPRDCAGYSLDGHELLMLGPHGGAYAVSLEVFVRHADKESEEE